MLLIKALRAAVVLVLLGIGPASAQYVMDIGNLILALRIGDFGNVAEGIADANTVYVARLSDIAAVRIRQRTLDQTIAARAGALRHLRAIVRQAPAAMKALERHGQTLDQVIFATYTNDGSATLYVDDR